MKKEIVKAALNLKGVEFVGLENYESKTSGEVSNVVLNMGVNVQKAKEKDLETLKNFDVNLLSTENKELAKVALNELIVSAEKNLNVETATNQSKGQAEAYLNLGNGLKLHIESEALHISGFAHSKTVLVEGEYKKVNKREKTLIKDEIKKVAKLRMNKYRNYIIKNMGVCNISGSKIIVK